MLPAFEAATETLPHWERSYMVNHFSLGVHSETRAEKLAARKG